MPRVLKTKSGIPDLDLKLQVCRQLLGAMTNLELADKVVSSGKDAAFALKVADSLRKWETSIPTKADGPKRFWDKLAFELDCGYTVNGAMLIHADIGRFIGYLPQDRQMRAREILANSRLGNGRWNNRPAESVGEPRPMLSLDPNDSNVIWLHHRGPIETIATGFRAGRIDQRHYYLDPDSASGWARLVRADAYPSYDHCKTGLQSLLESESWRRSLGISKPVTAVMLAGGGAPSKDLLLMRNLLAQPYATGRIYYFLVDISLYMLLESDLWIRDHWQTIHGSERVDLKLIHRDVLEMRTRHQKEFHEHGKVIFGITGGTIGNLSEANFFRSLECAALDGDLLLMSADTIDGVPSEDVETTLIGKYNHPDLLHFLRPVVRAVLGESNARESVDDALGRIEVTLRPGGEANSSDVPESWSVILTLEIDRRKITLVTSTRYQSSQLTAYAAHFGWHPICQIPGPLNPHFKQFLFQRNKVQTNGIHSLP